MRTTNKVILIVAALVFGMMLVASPAAADTKWGTEKNVLRGVGLATMAFSFITASQDNDTRTIRGNIGDQPVNIMVTETSHENRLRLGFANPFKSGTRQMMFVGGAIMMTTGIILDAIDSPVVVEASPTALRASYKVGW